MVPDMATLRLCPWLEKTAMVICDIYEEESDEPVRVAPRQILKDQLVKAAEMGFTVKTGSELEFYLFKDGYDELAERGYRDARPSSSYIMDYHMLQTTKDEWIIRKIRNDMRGRGHPDRVLEGRVRQGPARDQHHVLRRAVERRPPRDLQARREGDRGAQRRGRHLHGEVDDGRGGLLVPPALLDLEREGHEEPHVESRTASAT